MRKMLQEESEQCITVTIPLDYAICANLAHPSFDICMVSDRLGDHYKTQVMRIKLACAT